MKPAAALPLIVLLSVGTWTGVAAQSRAAEDEIVRSLDDHERLAALKRDVPTLERLWSDQFTVNAPNNQVVIGKRAVLEAFVHGGIINFSSFERTVEFMRVDGDFAFIMGAETVQPVGDAPMAGKTVHRRFTNIWKRRGHVASLRTSCQCHPSSITAAHSQQGRSECGGCQVTREGAA